MSRRKKKSLTLEHALKRLSGLQAISTSLDLGNGLTGSDYANQVQNLENLLLSYNRLLAQTDEAQNVVLAQEKAVRDLSERMLEGVGSKFGHNSNEYEKAGGTRKSDRKKSSRKKEGNGLNPAA
jgi:hypothetical protein